MTPFLKALAVPRFLGVSGSVFRVWGIRFRVSGFGVHGSKKRHDRTDAEKDLVKHTVDC